MQRRTCEKCRASLGDGEIRLCTRCRQDFHPGDTALRRLGFRVSSRPRRGPVVWERAGKLYTQEEADAVAVAAAACQGK